MVCASIFYLIENSLVIISFVFVCFHSLPLAESLLTNPLNLFYVNFYVQKHYRKVSKNVHQQNCSAIHFGSLANCWSAKIVVCVCVEVWSVRNKGNRRRVRFIYTYFNTSAIPHRTLLLTLWPASQSVYDLCTFNTCVIYNATKHSMCVCVCVDKSFVQFKIYFFFAFSWFCHSFVRDSLTEWF